MPPFLILLFLLLPAMASAAPLAGIYTAVRDQPVMQFVADGTKTQNGMARTTYALELNADGTLRTSCMNDRGTHLYARGVWVVQGDRVFFISQVVQETGEPLQNVMSLGSERFAATATELRLDEPVAHGLVGLTKLERTTKANLGPVLGSDIVDLKPILDRVVRVIPRPTYTPVASEQELITLVHRAVATRDVEALLRVSYPTLAGISADPQLGYYLSYMDELAMPGASKVSELSRSDLELKRELENLKKCCGCEFPAELAVRGTFMLERTSPDGHESGRGFFYGIVNGCWAIFGNPIDSKAADELKRSRQRG